ncbi:MAG: dTDP-glucose 4,6-dehydratase [Paenibacillaceae bacterium]
MKLLVTGGAGFIGSNFLIYMINKYPDYEFVNLDALTYAGNLENLRSIENNPQYSFIHGDITNMELVDDICRKGVNAIINFAAESHVDRSIVDPSVFITTNVVGTQVLLEASRKYEMTKYVQVSTDEVYGSLDDAGLFTEHTPLAPNSPYSASKAGADLLVRAYHETYQLPINITRCSNNYGPYQFPEKLIPSLITNTIQDKQLPLYGDGLNIRDWLHVEDHCRALDLVIHYGKSGDVYNIGGNNERTNLAIAHTILAELGKPASLITYVQDRLGHDRRYGIDATKITAQLGWEPKHDFVSGIKGTIDWYVENTDWLRSTQQVK